MVSIPEQKKREKNNMANFSEKMELNKNCLSTDSPPQPTELDGLKDIVLA